MVIPIPTFDIHSPPIRFIDERDILVNCQIPLVKMTILEYTELTVNHYNDDKNDEDHSKSDNNKSKTAITVNINTTRTTSMPPITNLITEMMIVI